MRKQVGRMERIYYVEDGRKLIVTFSSGAVVEHRDVEEEVFLSLMESSKRPEYYNLHIAPRYKPNWIQEGKSDH